ncbi:unnamed protein product [Effrenium voratum]|uniref:Uncharacterized protein n=1 Tax=Effrenium voratum TaxID=2562239 RepID=A0AA36J648_9DINO|nr:unnamed protein product [Effrenium voratum]CAJ1412573.1 unnamed protein product [Effrenium voratum]
MSIDANLEDCVSPMQQRCGWNPASCWDRDDDCSTCAPSPSASVGFDISPASSKERPERARVSLPTIDDGTKDIHVPWPQGVALDLSTPPQSPRSFFPKDFCSPRGSVPLSCPRAPQRSKAPPLMQALQSGADCHATCLAVEAVLAQDPEAAQLPFIECNFEPPLCCAVRSFCDAQVIRLLIERQADVHLCDSSERTALDIVNYRVQNFATAYDFMCHTFAQRMQEDNEIVEVLHKAGAVARKIEKPGVAENLDFLNLFRSPSSFMEHLPIFCR